MSIGSNQNLIEKDEREFTQIEKQKKIFTLNKEQKSIKLFKFK